MKNLIIKGLLLCGGVLMFAPTDAEMKQEKIKAFGLNIRLSDLEKTTKQKILDNDGDKIRQICRFILITDSNQKAYRKDWNFKDLKVYYTLKLFCSEIKDNGISSYYDTEIASNQQNVKMLDVYENIVKIVMEHDESQYMKKLIEFREGTLDKYEHGDVYEIAWNIFKEDNRTLFTTEERALFNNETKARASSNSEAAASSGGTNGSSAQNTGEASTSSDSSSSDSSIENCVIVTRTKKTPTSSAQGTGAAAASASSSTTATRVVNVDSTQGAQSASANTSENVTAATSVRAKPLTNTTDPVVLEHMRQLHRSIRK